MEIGLEYIFQAYIKLEKGIDVGLTANGFRNIVPIIGGNFKGNDLNGEVIPGGADWQLIRQDGIIQAEAKYTLKTDDGALIFVVNKGVINPELGYARASPHFEVSNEKYMWLCKSLFISEITPMLDEKTPISDDPSPSPNGVSIRFYRVT
ncbi:MULTISPECIES: DUF3237 family protein [Paraliobacillus]|uniref:DUF3237 family protein n=1 Tax=Paraliobacillus TaxID=200903 RepID=UPI000DD4AD07|nr:MULTISPECIES: DUF3237 family protein [Paraliobacillus]